MSREILFRAKTKATKEWTYGHFAKQYDVPQIYAGSGHECVYEDTLCQYTGLTDKNGTKIFEGDIVKYEWGFLSNGSYHHYEDFIVEFKDSAYYIVPIKKHKNIWAVYLNPESEYEVAGNIYDNNI